MSVNSVADREFGLEVLHRAPSHIPRAALDAAIAHYVRERMTAPGMHAPGCIALAADFAARVPDRQPRSPRITPEARRLTREMLKLIEPSVRKVRRDLFGEERPPFRALAAAATWIKQAERKPPRLSAAKQEEIRKLERRLMRDAGRVAAARGTRIMVKPGVETLSYQRPGERFVSRVAVPTEGHLADLQQAVRAMARVTGFAEDALVSHVLTGQRLELRPARGQVSIVSGTLPDGESVTRPVASIDIYCRDITDAELRKLYREIRKAWRGTRMRGFTEREQALLDAVDRLGGVPKPPNSKVFWTKVHRALGGRADDWRTSLMAWRRVREKIGK